MLSLLHAVCLKVRVFFFFAVAQHGMACWRIFALEMFFTTCPKTQKLCVPRWYCTAYFTRVSNSRMLNNYNTPSFLLNILNVMFNLNRLTPDDPYMGRTEPLTSKRCILYIYSTNIGTEYFKHIISVFFLFKMQFVS